MFLPEQQVALIVFAMSQPVADQHQDRDTDIFLDAAEVGADPNVAFLQGQRASDSTMPEFDIVDESSCADFYALLEPDVKLIIS
jgi:hypothetical protein